MKAWAFINYWGCLGWPQSYAYAFGPHWHVYHGLLHGADYLVINYTTISEFASLTVLQNNNYRYYNNSIHAHPEQSDG